MAFNAANTEPNVVTDGTPASFVIAASSFRRERMTEPDVHPQTTTSTSAVPSSEAARQMKSLVWLDGEEQLSAPYLGTSGQKGDLATVFQATGQFLFEQGTIREAPALKVFQDAINPSYLEAAVR